MMLSKLALLFDSVMYKKHIKRGARRHERSFDKGTGGFIS